MTDSVLDLLKLLFLGLLYVFFARVLWAVWSEVRQSNQRIATPVPLDTTPSGAKPPEVKVGVPAKTPRVRAGNPTKLVVIEPRDRKGVTYFVEDRVTFGRESDNTVVLLEDAYLSGHHLVVESDEQGKVTLTDLESRNGTLHNGSRVTGTRPIVIGDRIQIGYTVLEAQ